MTKQKLSPLQEATQNLRSRLNEHEVYLKTGKTRLPSDGGANDDSDRPSRIVKVRGLPPAAEASRSEQSK